MKRTISMLLALTLLFAGCTPREEAPLPSLGGPTEILLSDDGVTVDGIDATLDGTTSFVPAVYAANDSFYSPDGNGIEVADAHTVVHITAPGTYRVSGKLSQGQIAIDLGGYAKENPSATVRLILDGVDLTCTAAPAILFSNVWECDSDEKETAGAYLYLADGSENTVRGADVAIHSRMSMRVLGHGTLNLFAENAGIVSERHPTVDGPSVNHLKQ